MSKPKVAFVGTGGTIASLGRGPLDLQDYGAAGKVMHADEILARWPETALVADVVAVRYRNIVSPAIDFADWKALTALCMQLVREHPDLAGIVIGHGTATLEETAYFLNLALKVSIPVVVVGSQRPSSALSSDAGMNLVNAIRVAASPDARGMGVLVVLNDEIHAAREVTKTATMRLQTFRTPDSTGGPSAGMHPKRSSMFRQSRRCLGWIFPTPTPGAMASRCVPSWRRGHAASLRRDSRRVFVRLGKSKR
jgi:L-asparaginase